MPVRRQASFHVLSPGPKAQLASLNSVPGSGEQGAKMSQALQKPYPYKWGDLGAGLPHSSPQAMGRRLGWVIGMLISEASWRFGCPREPEGPSGGARKAPIFYVPTAHSISPNVAPSVLSGVVIGSHQVASITAPFSLLEVPSCTAKTTV